MQVSPHPHTGLQTVSWLFSGEIEHRDSAGHHTPVRPGELNLMTAGRGISHSEVSTPATRLLHGVQLWVALPDRSRHAEPTFEHHAPPPLHGPGWRARVFLGSAFGHTSPVTTHTPLLGAEVVIESGGALVVPVDPSFEHGVLVDSGVVTVGDVDAKPSELVYAAPGGDSLTLGAHDEPVRLLLLGGPPFGEPIVMWWNFVGRTHDEIVGYRSEWQAQVTRDGVVLRNSRDVTPGRFGVVDDPLAPIPAPELPNARLKERW
jgi:redox-sensitive bicupin YhaK (pirin superfamily)